MERIPGQGSPTPLRQPDVAATTSGQGAEGAQAPAQGIFQGQTVTVLEDSSSMLASAAEELTFGASEEVERKLSQRKENGERRAMLLQQVELFIQNTGNLDKNELEQLLKQLTLMESVKANDIVELVKRHFPDSTDQHAALVLAREEIAKQPELPPALVEALEESISEAIIVLETTDGANIRAGYNIAGVDPGAMEESSRGLRVLYRDSVISFDSYSKTFETLTTRFGLGGFKEALNFLMRALGADMAALTPSCPPAQLKETMDGLYMAEALGTVHQNAESLIGRIELQFGLQNLFPPALVQPLLGFLDAPVLVEEQITREMPFLETGNAERDASLLQGIFDLAHEMPHRLSPSQNQRQNLLDALQSLLSKAAEREDTEAGQ